MGARKSYGDLPESISSLRHLRLVRSDFLSEDLMLGRFLKNYIERHRHPGNQVFHLIGLPVTFILPCYFLAKGEHVWALASFLIGYSLQFIGHAIEGNDAGELIVIKKLLGKPYIEFGPRSKNSSEND